MNKALSKLLAATLFTLVATACTTETKAPCFVQISDPQLGFITESADFSPEQANMEIIAAAVNKLKPDFVVFTGDYVQWRTDENALEGFRAMHSLFDPSIPLYILPGNHDVGEATPEDMELYIARYGHDKFMFEGCGYTAIGYNSCLVKSDAEGEDEHYEWMKRSLQRASERGLPIVVAAHHPFFVESPDEEDAGVNIPQAMRPRYLDLFEQYGVDLALSGHLHHCVRAEYKGMQMATTSAAGRPLGEEDSGITVVTFPEGTPTPIFYDLAALKYIK